MPSGATFRACMPGLPSLAQPGCRRHTLIAMGRQAASRGARALRLRAGALAALALLAFLLPAFGPRGQAEASPAPFPLVICTADGLVLLTPEGAGEGTPADEAHELSCLACLLRLAPQPHAPDATLRPPALSAAPAPGWASSTHAARAPPHLRPDKTGPPAGA